MENKSEWRECELGEVCSFGDGAHSKVKRVKNGIPYLTSKNLKNGKLDLSNLDFISKEDFNKLFSKGEKAIKGLRDGDILMGIIGTFGNCYRYTKKDNFGISSSIGVARPISTLLNSDYLYYHLSSKRFMRLTEKYKGGSVQGYTNLPTLRKMPINIPSLQKQEKIASILKSLDDKIELNNQMNETLEEMAQNIFKEWFVEFNFPVEGEKLGYKASGGEMVESELGMIPKGWRVEELKTCGTTITGKTPPTSKKEFYGLDVPFIKTPDMHGKTYIVKTENYLSILGAQYQEKKYVPKNTLIMSCIGAKAGTVALTSEDSQFNQQINGFIPYNKEDVYYFYQYLNLEKENLRQKGSSGSTMININKTTFEKHKYIIPNDAIKNLFLIAVKSSFKEIKKNYLENQSLIKTRDTLLPKLMSGEVRV